MATNSRTRSQAVRQSLRLYIEPPSCTTTKASGSSYTSPPASGTDMLARSDSDDSYRPDSSAIDFTLFSVLCLYDFSSEDPGLLSFNKYEILDVVKCDHTGWWAAMRKDGPVVGWIPQAYVVQLSDEMAWRLRNVREEFRGYEYEAEQLYNSAPVSRIPALYDIDSAATSPLPEYQFQENALSAREASNSQHFRPDNVRQPSHGRVIPPPSPSSAMPLPPSTGRKKATPLTPQRSLRSRPVAKEDNLTRLNNLIETKSTRHLERKASITVPLDFPSKSGRGEKPLKRQGSGVVRHRIEAVIHIRPWYLQPLLAHEIEEDANGYIRNATLLALIERLSTHDTPVDLTRQAEFTTFTNVFLTTFRTFTTANKLFDILVDRYNTKHPNTLSEAEFVDWKANCQIPTRKRILQIFSVWLEEHRFLEEEPHLAKPLTDFLRTINTAPHNTDAEAIVRTLERLTFTVRSEISVRTRRKSSGKLKNDLLKVEPSEMAEQLALWEHALYAKVTPQDCLSYAKDRSGVKVARLLAFCGTHDNLGAWVKSSVLNHEILGKRAATVDFWIKVAEKCRALNNIASMSAIIIALSSTVITQLHLTMAHISRRSILEALLRYNEPAGGFAAYRLLVREAEGPCVPFISMYLNDIVHAEENFANQDTGGRICFYKRARWFEIISTMLKFTKRSYNIRPNDSTKHFIESHLRMSSKYDSNWFWSKSQEVQHSELAHADIRKGLEAAGF